METFAWLEGIRIEVVLRFITADSGVLLATVDGAALNLQQSASNWVLLEFGVQLECTLMHPVPIRLQFIAIDVLAACIVVVFLSTVPIAISRMLHAPIQVSEIIIVIQSCLCM